MSAGTTRVIFERRPVYRSSKAPQQPHNDRSNLGVVYANSEAQKAITSGSRFPFGSIIVREKVSNDQNTKPELLSVMVKRERGFNPAGGDWLFLTINGEMTKLKSSQKKGSCLGCHTTQRDTDFVYRLENGTVPAK